MHTLSQDIHEPLNRPEKFAAQVVADLQLPQELETAIAHSISEQVTNYRQLLSRASHLTLASNSTLHPDDLPLKFPVNAKKRLRLMPEAESGSLIHDAQDSEHWPSNPEITMLLPREQMELSSGTWARMRSGTQPITETSSPKKHLRAQPVGKYATPHTGIAPVFNSSVVQPSTAVTVKQTAEAPQSAVTRTNPA